MCLNIEKATTMQAFITEGLTVTELKALIKDWPEVDALGEPTEVWLEDMSGSSQVREVWPLNKKDGSADIIFTLGD